jgi:hypothetical protein
MSKVERRKNQRITGVVTSPPGMSRMSYSYRNASIGSRRDARRAG